MQPSNSTARIAAVVLLFFLPGCGSAGVAEHSHAEMAADQASRQYNRANELTVPYIELMRYPDDWPYVSSRRDPERRESGDR